MDDPFLDELAVMDRGSLEAMIPAYEDHIGKLQRRLHYIKAILAISAEEEDGRER